MLVFEHIYRVVNQMATNPSDYHQALVNEIERTPVEFREKLLQIVRSFRESVTAPSDEDSFRQSWQEAIQGKTYPVDTLWDGIETD